jgi:hypothetical protein
MSIFSELKTPYNILSEAEDVINLEDHILETLMNINMEFMDLYIDDSQTSYMYESLELIEIVQEGTTSITEKTKKLFEKLIVAVKNIFKKATEYIYALIRGNKAFIKKYGVNRDSFKDLDFKEKMISLREVDFSVLDYPKMEVLMDVQKDVTYNLVALQKDPETMTTKKVLSKFKAPGVLEDIYGKMIGSDVAITKEELMSKFDKFSQPEKEEQYLDTSIVMKYFDIFDKTEKYIDELRKQETKLVLSIKQFKDEKSYAPPEGLNGDGWVVFKDADYNTKRNIIVQYFINVVNMYLVIFNRKIRYLQALNSDACKVISVAYRRRRGEGSEE